jgi:hypothetical protein
MKVLVIEDDAATNAYIVNGLRELNAAFFERREVIDGALCAVLAGEHVLLSPSRGEIGGGQRAVTFLHRLLPDDPCPPFSLEPRRRGDEVWGPVDVRAVRHLLSVPDPVDQDSTRKLLEHLLSPVALERARARLPCPRKVRRAVLRICLAETRWLAPDQKPGLIGPHALRHFG